MRGAFIRTLTVLAKADPRIILATGDLGFKIFDDFRTQCPRQFLNVGVAEASLMGMAAGMALEGKKPFCYSIASFLTMRPFEHIRNDICFHKADVKIVGVGGGFSYGPNGPSHHALNDVALMRALPEMKVLTPGDPYEAAWAIKAAHQCPGPVYVRLGRSGEPAVHGGDVRLALGKSILMEDGKDIAILASGLMLKTGVEAAGLLKAQGLSVRLVSFPSVKPLDEAMLADTFRNCGHIFTLEEHGIAGGFGAAVAEFAITKDLNLAKMHIIAAPDETTHQTGSHEYLREQAGLTAPQVYQAMLLKLDKNLC